MQKRFNKYLDKTFSSLPKTDDVLELREEILSNLMEKAAEYKNQDMPDDRAYKLCIDSLGDYTEAIRALKTNAIDYVKSRDFRSLYRITAVYSLSVLLAYFITSFVTGRWNITFVIPTAGAVLYFSALIIYFLRIAATVKRLPMIYLYETFLLILWSISLYFILSFGGVGFGKSWLVFTTMPAAISLTLLLTKLICTKKLGKVLYATSVILLSVAIYLLVSVMVPAFSYGKAWVIILGGLLVLCASANGTKAK